MFCLLAVLCETNIDLGSSIHDKSCDEITGAKGKKRSWSLIYVAMDWLVFFNIVQYAVKPVYDGN